MRIAVNDRLTLDIQMEVGNISEKMVVSAEGQLLETTSSSVATLIDHRRLTEMPLIYGNPMMLQFLAAGTTWNAPLHYQAPWDGSGASMSSVNGSKTRSIDFQVDGISNNTKGNDIAYTPSVEFIEEYKVETTAYDASQGHGAAWVNASMKSGTNELHGSAYMYIQHKDLNANGFFANLAGQPKGYFNYDRWQTSAGGPLIKNKTFWFTGIERIKNGSLPQRIFTVPTAAERNGDLSALLALGGQYQIYDPWTTTNLNNGRYSRQPFAGNIIPASRISPIAKAVLKYYPEPNNAPSPTREGLNNFIYEKGTNQNAWWSFSSRVDHNFNEKSRLFGRYGFTDRTLNENGYDFAPGASAGNSKGVSKVAALDYTHVFDASTVADIRYGFTRSYFGILSMTKGLRHVHPRVPQVAGGFRGVQAVPAVRVRDQQLLHHQHRERILRSRRRSFSGVQLLPHAGQAPAARGPRFPQHPHHLAQPHRRERRIQFHRRVYERPARQFRYPGDYGGFHGRVFARPSQQRLRQPECVLGRRRKNHRHVHSGRLEGQQPADAQHRAALRV